jgi:hypothetical protein
MPPEIKIFLEKVIEEKKFDNLSPELREAMVSSLYPRLQTYIFTAITKQLDEATVQELDKMMEGSLDYSQPELQMFLKGRVKNIEEVVASAMLEFRSVYLNS